MVRKPDGHGRLELIKFARRPPAGRPAVVFPTFTGRAGHVMHAAHAARYWLQPRDSAVILAATAAKLIADLL
jgi:hypothetical protein